MGRTMNRILLVRRPGLAETARWMPAWPSPPCRRFLHLTCARRQEAAASETKPAESSIPLQRRRVRVEPPEGVPWRTRFAPSPTGFLHLGSLRTALFSYLAARKSGGQFVLRVEDTDRTRLVPGAEERLYRDLKWAGLSWDEGPDVSGSYGPYRQSERLSLYKEHADKLLRQGKAYRCFCPQGQASVDRQDGEFSIYSGICRTLDEADIERRLAAGDAFAVRFKSSRQPVVVLDVVYGRYVKKKSEDDFIIMKRDGFPTYHFANVVDDKHMNINFVIRGVEWLISTPMHVDLYNAFGWNPPAFAHIGLLTDAKGRKLSKRDPTVDISFYQERDTLPPALLNFAALLGWSGPRGKSQFLTPQDMIDKFTTNFTKGAIIVKPEKLGFFQSRHWLHLLHEEPPQMDLLDAYLIKPVARRIWEVDTMLKNVRRIAQSKSSYRYATVTPAAFDSTSAAESAAGSGSGSGPRPGDAGEETGVPLEGAKTQKEISMNSAHGKKEGIDYDDVGLDKPYFLGGLDRRANGLLNATPDRSKAYLLSMLRHGKRTFNSIDFAVLRFRYMIWRPSLFAYRRSFYKHVFDHAENITVAGAESSVDGVVEFFERQLGAVPETAAETTAATQTVRDPAAAASAAAAVVAATETATSAAEADNAEDPQAPSATVGPAHEFIWAEGDGNGADPYQPWSHDQLRPVLDAALGQIGPEATATAKATPTAATTAATATAADNKTDHHNHFGIRHDRANKLGYAVLRWALLASDSVPGLADIMRQLGKREVMARLRRARESLLPPGAPESLVVPAWLQPYLSDAEGGAAGSVPPATNEGAGAGAGADLPGAGADATA